MSLFRNVLDYLNRFMMHVFLFCFALFIVLLFVSLLCSISLFCF